MGYTCTSGDFVATGLAPLAYATAVFVSIPAAAAISKIRLGSHRPSPVWGLVIGARLWWLIPLVVKHFAGS